jgi:hypothetical protein
MIWNLTTGEKRLDGYKSQMAFAGVAELKNAQVFLIAWFFK